jgi:cytochrome c oxidase subunit 2
VVVELCSTDVVHRWWVPGLGGKFDAVPGESNSTWFKADQTGSYDGASYAFSGAAYSVMRTRVTVVDVPTYESWLDEQAAGIQEAQSFVQRVNAES